MFIYSLSLLAHCKVVALQLNHAGESPATHQDLADREPNFSGAFHLLAVSRVSAEREAPRWLSDLGFGVVADHAY
jgi:hypothetical protein